MSRLFPRYATAALCYGVGRKIVLTHGATVRDDRDNSWPRYERDKLPMLVSQRASVVLFGGAVSAVYAPLYAFVDAGRIETWLRGVDAGGYGYKDPETFMEHVLW